MFGTKIRSWMEAHLARSRAKKKKQQPELSASPQFRPAHPFEPSAFFGAAATPADFDEILPTLPISASSFKPAPRCNVTQHNGTQQQQQQQYEGGNTKVVGRQSAVNLSSPESAYSTGYSTDGTSPCATYAPEHYINVRPQTQLQHQLDARERHARKLAEQHTSRLAGEEKRELHRINDRTYRQIDSSGTYSVRGRHVEEREGREYQQQQQQQQQSEQQSEQQQQQHHPWRKPAPPTPTRPLTSSPKLIQSAQLVRKLYDNHLPEPTNYPMQLFSPRRMPLVTTTTTQVMPIKSPRQRSRLRTNPWLQPSSGKNSSMVYSAGGACRPWSRQQQQQPFNDYCCRQESLSVGRSPVNRSDWRSSAQQRQRQRLKTRLRSSTSSASSCSNRSRSCSVSSTNSASSSNSSSSSSSSSSSNSNNTSSSTSSSSSSSPARSPSSDDVTLNEVIGKFDENYLYEKETDIISDHSGSGGVNDNSSFSVNFSSDVSGSSFELQVETSGRSLTSSRLQRELSGRRQRRKRHRKPVEIPSKDNDDKEHREEIELLQEVLNRRLKKNNSEASAQTNRALLERLLMKNAASGFETRRAWSTNPTPTRQAASRSVGGTPICLRRKTRASHLFTQPSRLISQRKYQVHPAESTNSLKNISASELALMEADKEADLKYAQLIREAERMLVRAQEQLQWEESANNSRRGSTSSVAASEKSPSRFLRRQLQPQICTGSAPNKRVELIKNAELNIELALSKSKNSQPELSNGSIKDLLDHSSPKRLLQQQQKKMIEPMVTQAVASTQTIGSDFPHFQSLDVNPAQSCELSCTSDHYSCPQSEPVKRKVYEGHDSCGRLLQRQPDTWLRNSDSDFANEQLLQPQPASAASSYSQLRKQMLIETLQGLKQSLQNQSEALQKMSCLQPI